jgi:hypothetical protein
MDKVQNKPNSSVQHTPSSESFQVYEMISSVTATRDKLMLRISDIKRKTLLHFPNLKKFMSEAGGEENFESLPFLDDLESLNSKGTSSGLVQLNQ